MAEQQMNAQEALAAVRALADEWDVMAASHASPAARVNIGRHADALRAVLDAAGVEPTPAEVDWTFDSNAPHACEPPGGFGRGVPLAAPVDAVPVGVTEAYVIEHLADYLRDWRSARCEHGGPADEQACTPCLRDRMIAALPRLAAAPVGGPDLAERIAQAWDEGRGAGISDMAEVIGWAARGAPDPDKPAAKTPNPYRSLGDDQ